MHLNTLIQKSLQYPLIVVLPPILAASIPPRANFKADLGPRAKFAGYDLVPMQFNGTLWGHGVASTGTIQDVHNQMLETYPDHDPAMGMNVSISTYTKLARGETKMNCCPISGQNFTLAFAASVDDRIQSLRAHPGSCGAPSHSCVIASCKDHAAIYLCNDNTYTITPNCVEVANLALEIYNGCNEDIENTDSVCGQAFGSDGIRVVVEEGGCN